ncbi:MAG TPA: glutathione S-transferase family protein [Dokdonella sp.]
MSLVVYLHPLASFCMKVLMALYENDTPFEPRIVDLADADSRARFLDVWPIGRFPVLFDAARAQTLPESTIIIEYLARHYPGRTPLLPDDADAALEVRLWDRFCDHYVDVPMQKIVTDKLRPAGCNDAPGVQQARSLLQTAYGVLDARLASRTWIAGDHFGMADCAAAPALFYANKVQPFDAAQAHLAAYFDRLLQRPSFIRVLHEAQPYFAQFPG